MISALLPLQTLTTLLKFSGIILACGLSACATATRGSHTVFLVNSVPEGAIVETDLKRPQGEAISDDGVDASEYYGCAPTPCGFKLLRRSDFNVMVRKEGYQPFTYAVIKDRASKKERKLDPGTANAAVSIAAGTVVAGIAYSSTTKATLAPIFTPAPALTYVAVGSVFYAVPLAGAAGAIDMASGALIDLNPNPLNVELKTERSKEESNSLIDTFKKTRQARAERLERTN